jgi:TonB family protein
VANFIGLANGTKDYTDPATKQKVHGKPYYDGTTFHRVIPGFMIQGGDPTGTGMGDPGYGFGLEVDPNLNFDAPGRLAMAHSDAPNTNGSQFFITEQGYDSLNQHYTLFGQCDDASVDVVKAIARVHTGAEDKPVDPVILKKVTIVAEGENAPAVVGSGSDVGAPPKRVNISAGVAQGLLEHKVTPTYPMDAKAAGISGTVSLQALIGRNGRIDNLKVVSGPDALQQAALDAVKDWVYRPFLLNGEPVEVVTTVNVIFSLAK